VFTASYAASGWTVEALHTFHTVTEAAEPKVHVWRARAGGPTAFLYVSQRTSHVVSFQPIANFLDKNNGSCLYIKMVVGLLVI